ncbi:hypothetical protein Adt_05402 [Abeliophyllum distichum]|uniref:Uncharacterized protein n=1 Tax=Abeliophyllum distichum TaxID=126358 RepID=A0ABD1V3Z6_9LAMI
MGPRTLHPLPAKCAIFVYPSEKAVEEVTVREQLQLAEVNLARGFVLAKELFSAFKSFDVEEAQSKKLAEDLKAMGLEKVQLESDKRVPSVQARFGHDEGGLIRGPSMRSS